MAKPDVQLTCNFTQLVEINRSLLSKLATLAAPVFSLALGACSTLQPDSQWPNEPGVAESCSAQDTLLVFPETNHPSLASPEAVSIEGLDRMVEKKLQFIIDSQLAYPEVIALYQKKRSESLSAADLEMMRVLDRELDRCLFKYNQKKLENITFFQQLPGWDGLDLTDQVGTLNRAIASTDLAGQCLNGDDLSYLKMMLELGMEGLQAQKAYLDQARARFPLSFSEFVRVNQKQVTEN